MQNDIDETKRRRNSGKVVIGFFFLLFGGILLLEQVGGLFFPSWLFGFPMWILAFGIYLGAKHDFAKPFPFVLMALGGILVLNDILPGHHIDNLFWPIIIIGIGMTMILNRNSPRAHRWDKKRFRGGFEPGWDPDQQYQWDKKVNPEDPTAEPAAPKTDYSNAKSDFNEDYLMATSVFGSAHKTIYSKNFKGGEIVNIFGGAEIDFTQSDINGRVVIDVTQIFGGIKLLVPPHWHVTSDSVSLFAGFDDKRKLRTATSNDKILIITGTSIFAGVEIRSY